MTRLLTVAALADDSTRRFSAVSCFGGVGALACTGDGQSFLTGVSLFLVSGASATAAPQIYSEFWTFLSFLFSLKCAVITLNASPCSDATRPKISCFVHINTRIVGGHRVLGTDGSWVVSIQRE